MRAALVLLAAVSGLLAVPVLAQSDICTDGGAVTCEACQGADQDSESVSMVPRLNAMGATTSAQMGDYSWFANGEATVSADAFTNPTAAPADSPVHYVVGMLTLTAVLFLFFLLVTLCAVDVCVQRHCCCCCKSLCQRYCSVCLCGDSEPTAKKRMLSCGGFTRNGEGFSYSFLERSLARCGVCAVMLGLIIIALLGYLNGNLGLSSSTLRVLHMPDTSIDLFRDTLTPTAELIDEIASRTFPELLLDTQQLFNETLDLNYTANKLECGIGKFDGAIPNFTNIDAGIGKFADFLDAAEDEAAQLFPALDAVENGVDRVGDRVSELNETLKGIQRTLDDTAEALEETKEAMEPVTGLVEDLTGTEGTVKSIDDDLKMTQNNYPTEGQLDNGTDAATYFATMATTEADSKPEKREQYFHLRTVLWALEDLPDYSVTADTMEEFNDIVDEATADDGSIATLITVLNATNATLEGLPKSSLVTDDVEAIFGAVDQIPLIYVRWAVLNITEKLEEVPTGDAILSELEQLEKIEDMLPCLRNATDEMLKINESIIAIPDSMAQLFDIDGLFNGTLDGLLGTINSTRELLNGIREDILAVNSTELLSQIDDAEAQIVASKDKVNVSTIEAQMDALSSAKLDLGVIDSLDALNESLANARISQSNIDEFRSLNDTVENAINTLSRDLALLRVYIEETGQIVCENNHAVDCDTNGDDTCDSSVGAGELCLNDADRMAALGGLMTALDTARPDVQSLRDNLADTSESASNVDVASLENQLSSSNDSLLAVDIASFQAQLDGVNDQLSDLPLDSVNDTINNQLLGPINNFNITSFESQIETLKSTLDELRDNFIGILESFIPFLRTLDELLYVHFPIYVERLHPDRIRADRLRPVDADSNAPGDVLETLLAVAWVIDNSTAILAPSFPSALAGGDDNSSESLLGNGTDMRGMLLDAIDEELHDRIAFDTFYDHGRLYYIYSIIAYFQNTTFVSHEDSNARTVNADADGNAYDDGAFCLTDDCLATTDYAIHKEPILNLMPADSRPVDSQTVPLTREHLFLIISNFGVLILLLLGCCTLTMPMVCCRGEESGKSAAWCPCFFTFGVWVATPVFLLLAAFVVFPVVFVNDVCSGVENVGAQYVTSLDDSFCSDTLGGNGTNSHCIVSFDLSAMLGSGDDDDDSSNSTTSWANSTSSGSGDSTSGEVSAVIDLEGVALSILGGCPSGPDPVGRVFRSFGKSARHELPAALNNFVDGFGEGIGIRDPTLEIVYNTSDSLGNLTRVFANSMADVVTCDALHEVFLSFKEPVCCGVNNSLYWILMPVPFIALLLCFVGLFCSCYARKRLGNAPWGKAYEEALDRATTQGGSADFGEVRISQRSPRGGRGAARIAAPPPAAAPAGAPGHWGGAAPHASPQIRGTNPAYPRRRK